MKFLRYGPKGREKPGLLDGDGTLRDLSDHIPDIAAEALTPKGMAALMALDPSALPTVEGNPRLGACVSGVGKFLCIGLNYAAHARESGMETPAEPILFTKATSSISGPYDPVELPRGSTKTDWEVELAVVIGKPGKHIAEKDAAAHIAGYTIVNDVSERALQLEGTGQWVKGKSCDTFGPVGPWLVTADEIPDPQNLNLWLDVNGERRQDGNTGHMIHGVMALVSYLSGFFTLQTGDIISTGTPPGVGLGMDPPTYLKAGEEMRLGIDGLGEQCQKVIDEA